MPTADSFSSPQIRKKAKTVFFVMSNRPSHLLVITFRLKLNQDRIFNSMFVEALKWDSNITSSQFVSPLEDS